jgi:hypothetical protein
MVAVLLFANFVGSFAVDLWVEHFAPRQRTVVCQFPIHIKPEVVAFVPAWLGHYEQWSFSLHFAFLGLFFLVICWYALKGQIVRVR